MKSKSIFSGILVILLFSGSLLAQQDSTMYNLLRFPRAYVNNEVLVKGIVEQYIPERYGTRSSTVEYILRGDFGDKVLVRSTLEVPETNTKYEVRGMFQLSAKADHNYEIVEIARLAISTAGVEDATITTPVTAAPPLTGKTEQTIWERYSLAFLIAGGVVVLLLIILLSVFMFKKKPEAEHIYSAQPIAEPKDEDFSSTNEFKTVKVATNIPKTMRFIPGKLEIVTGEDKGKAFKMVGYPTSEGSIITMGRENGSGERSYSHIQLKDPTVSRKQAEFIYKNEKLFLKNQSETNFTVVNGKELATNEQIELKPNDSLIRAGAIEFKYVV